MNDLRDADDDRLHPVKRDRPIARGELEPERALVLAGLLAAGALAIAAALGFSSLLFLLGFVALQLAYSLGLKRIVLVDVCVIAGLFVIRAAAGAAAVDVRISPWLLVCTALLALFLGLAKRRGELVLVHADETPGREALGGYSLALVDRLLNVVAAATAGAYAAYTVTAHSAWMALTAPFVVARARPLSRARAPARSRRGAGARAARGPRDPRVRRRVGRPVGRRARR